jgi:hypothetical protein
VSCAVAHTGPCLAPTPYVRECVLLLLFYVIICAGAGINEMFMRKCRGETPMVCALWPRFCNILDGMGWKYVRYFLGFWEELDVSAAALIYLGHKF